MQNSPPFHCVKHTFHTAGSGTTWGSSDHILLPLRQQQEPPAWLPAPEQHRTASCLKPRRLEPAFPMQKAKFLHHLVWDWPGRSAMLCFFCLRDETLAPEAIIPSEIPLSGDDNASTSLLKGMGWSALSSTPLQPPSCSTCASELKHNQVPVPSPCRFTSLPKTKTSQLTSLTPGSSNGPR